MAPEKITKIDEVAAELRRRITEGEYVSGQRLPSVRELCEELHVNAATIRSALMRLQAENLLQILPRSGTFVRSSSPRVTIGPQRPSHDAEEPRLKHFGTFQRDEISGKFIRARFLESPQIIEIGKELGARIGMKSDTKMLRRYRVILIDGVPYHISDTYTMASSIEPLEGDPQYYLPPKYKPSRDALNVPSSFIQEIPSSFYHGDFLINTDPNKQPEFRNLEVLTCRTPSAEEAALLNIAMNQPVMVQEIMTWSYDGRFWEYSYVVANSALHEFSYSYDVAKDGSRLTPRIP